MIYFENRRYAQKNPTTKIKRDRNQNIGEWSEIKKPSSSGPCGFAEMLFRPESLEEFASQSVCDIAAEMTQAPACAYWIPYVQKTQTS
jgi:hypothetical protein